MKRFSLLLIHLLTVFAKLLGPGGIKGIIAENILLKQQLLVVCQPRQRAPNLLPGDRGAMQFIADNLGKWLIHCHMAEHMAGGILTWFEVT